MMDAAETKRFQESCTHAAQGYATATGAAYAAMATSMFQTWIETLEAVRPGKTEPEQPKSWYRHPDKVEVFSPVNAASTAWPNAAFAHFAKQAGNPASAASAPTNPWMAVGAIAQMNPAMSMFMGMMQPNDRSQADPTPFWATLTPLPGWWTMLPTRHPTVTWPMAYGMTVAGVPRAVAWPIAEANAAAMDAAQTAMQAMEQTLNSPTAFQVNPTVATSPATPTPAAFAISMQTAGADAMKAWFDGFMPPSNGDRNAKG